MDHMFRDPGALDRPVDEVMSPPLPTVGIGQPVQLVVELLEGASGGAGARRRPTHGGAQPVRRAEPSSPAAPRRAFMSEPAAGFDDPGESTPGSRPIPTTRRGRAADHAVDHVRPDGGRRARRVRVRAQRQPDPRRPRDVPRRRSKAQPTASRSPAAWPPRTPSCACSAPGDRVVLGNDAYGGTFRLIDKVHAPERASRGRRVDLTDLDALADGVAGRHRAWCGSRRRPTRCSTIVDIAAVAALAHAHGALVRRRQHVRHAVPAAAARARRRHRRALDDEVPRRPLRRRRRLRRHSTTTRSPSGSASCRTRPAPCRRPFDCYLVLRGRQDARGAHGPPLRERRGASSHALVRTRGRSGDVPGPRRPSRPRRRGPPDARLRAAWCRSRRAAARHGALEVVARTRLFTLAESLGAVESLIEHPGRMTHASVAGSPLAGRPGADPAVGRHRDEADLVADLAQALNSTH